MTTRHRNPTTDPAGPDTQELRLGDGAALLMARNQELEAALDASQAELQRQSDRLRTVSADLGHYRELFDFAPLPLLIMSRSGIIKQANLSAACLFGATRTALEGQPLLCHAAPESRGALLEHLRRCRTGRLPDRVEVVLARHDDRDPAPVEIHSHCRDRDPDRMFTTLLDLTDRNQAEAERRRAGEIEAVAKAQDRFLSLVSHELRTPIAPIANLVEVLRMRADVPETVKPILEIMERNVWMEVRLIDDLLDVTRIRRGKLQISREPIDLRDVLRNVRGMLANDFEAAGVTLSLEFEAASSHLQADPTRISQMFWNLLGNALKFTPRGGQVSVRLSNPAPDRVLAQVADSGCGIAPDAIEGLFEPFEQVRDGYKKGLGLGLAIARGIVEGHGGTIEVHSDGPGRGAVFSVTLPLAG
jgi:PAS domain S-box-containing protein